MNGDDKKKQLSHYVGMGLDALSVDELAVRIEMLRDEIVRLEHEVEKKSASRTAAEDAFKI